MRASSLRRPARPDRDRSLAEVETLAWLLDNSIPIPGFGGRRIGLDGIVGLIPGIGDLAGGAIGLFVVWRGSRLGLPRIVVARMLVTTLIDIVIGAIPLIGDVFDLWFKATTRNLRLMQRHLADPDVSTRDDWLAVLLMVGALLAVVAAIGWFVVALIGAVVGLFS